MKSMIQTALLFFVCTFMAGCNACDFVDVLTGNWENLFGSGSRECVTDLGGPYY